MDNCLSIVIIVGVLLLALIIYAQIRGEKERKKAEEERIKTILEHQDEWGVELCDNLVAKRITIDMTDEMVRLSLGDPTTVDSIETTAKGTKFRWIYGTPRRGAVYIWFKDGKVVKLKE